MTDESPLLEAHRLVSGDRGDSYGSPWEDYARTVAIFNGITGRDLTTAEGILFMVAVKLSRVAHGLDVGLPPERLRDSITDGAGYLDCLWQTIVHERYGGDGGGRPLAPRRRLSGLARLVRPR